MLKNILGGLSMVVVFYLLLWIFFAVELALIK